MRAPVAPVVAACCLFAQCAVLVRGACFNPGDPVGDGVYYCTMRLSGDKDMNFNRVSLDTSDPLTGDYDPALFERQEAELEFNAPGTDSSPACLHLEEIELTFFTYFYEETDRVVLHSFEGEDPATQDPLGKTVTVARILTRSTYDYNGNYEDFEYYADYGDVFIGISCELDHEDPQPTEQIAFTVDH